MINECYIAPCSDQLTESWHRYQYDRGSYRGKRTSDEAIREEQKVENILDLLPDRSNYCIPNVGYHNVRKKIPCKPSAAIGLSKHDNLRSQTFSESPLKSVFESKILCLRPGTFLLFPTLSHQQPDVVDKSFYQAFIIVRLLLED